MKKLGIIIAFIIYSIFFPGKISAYENRLVNGDFDTGSVDPWTQISEGGATAVISSDIKTDTSIYSLKVSHDKTGSYGFQQTVNNIVGGKYYEALGSGFSNDPNLKIYFMRIAWYISSDGSGEEMSGTVDSNTSGPSGEWTDIDLLSAQAPANALSAKVRIVLESNTENMMATAYFDDLVFQETTAPVTPAIEPSSTSTPIPTVISTPIPTVISTATPTPTKKPTPTMILIPTLVATNSGEILLETAVLPTPTGNDSQGEILGVSTGNINNNLKLPVIFISSGLFLLIVSLGAFLFPKIREHKLNNNIINS